MEGFGRRKVAGLVIAMIVMMMAKSTESKLHKIGARGWIPNYNYTEWLSQYHEHFYVGDWLYFVFDVHSFNVLEVNETSYQGCNDQDFIKNHTRGGRDVVELKEARPYYFLSSGGYCWNGMKVAILVQQLPVAPVPAPSKNIASHPFSSNSSSLIMIILLIAFYYLALAILH